MGLHGSLPLWMNKVKLSGIKHWPRKNTHQNQNNQQVKHYQRHKPFITASVGVESNKNYFFVYVLLTVHLSIILANDQLDATDYLFLIS
jgi:AAA15 family ATPase/GTPase